MQDIEKDELLPAQSALGANRSIKMGTLRLKTEAGRLTRYAFSCGYVERYENNDNNYLILSRAPNDYHVKGFIDNKHLWLIFDHVAEARKFINKNRLKWIK